MIREAYYVLRVLHAVSRLLPKKGSKGRVVSVSQVTNVRHERVSLRLLLEPLRSLSNFHKLVKLNIAKQSAVQQGRF